VIPFREAWGADFEFQALPGERPYVWCMSAREYYSGRHIRMWREELLALHRPPFDAGPDALFVAFYASAEIGCFLELGWDLPVNTLDLFAEHRCATNGRPLPMGLGNGLLDVLTLHGLGHIDAGEKKAMRDLAIRGAPFTSEEQTALQDYATRTRRR
jgi:DNA polymerase-1